MLNISGELRRTYEEEEEEEEKKGVLILKGRYQITEPIWFCSVMTVAGIYTSVATHKVYSAYAPVCKLKLMDVGVWDLKTSLLEK